MSILALALTLAAPETIKADIAGTWRTQNDKALVHIAPCGDAWCGRIVKLLKPVSYQKSHDLNNPDPALRGRPIVGITILTGFHREDGEWRGQVYDPVHGKNYRSTLATDGDVLRVKGCIAFFCKTQVWPRAG
ncbi:DUF2147 domain-containing protein [Sphingomonas koreensis]|nr:DUF2147 domain-containing protein [Sphingomonas koreensis]